MSLDDPLTDAQAQRLITLYNQAEKEILREVNRLLLKNPESYSLAWQKTVLARVRQIRNDLLDGARTWTQEAIQDSYLKGVSWADKDALAGTILRAGFGGIHQQAVQVLAENTYSRFIGVDQIVGRRVDDVFREVALKSIKGSVIGYETTRQAAKRIKDDLAERGITGFIDRSGREWDMSTYAEMLATESTNQTFRQGTINRFEERGNDLVTVSEHAGSCEDCAQYEGEVFSLSGDSEEYPPLEDAIDGGLFHVRCKHVLSLAQEEQDRQLEKLSGDTRDEEIQRLLDEANANGGE
jgi:hypothetical protein